MKIRFSLVSCLFGLISGLVLGLGTASAQVYQWKDASGRTIISDTPPGNAQGSRRIGGQPAADTAPPAAPKTMAEKEIEFRKRQQDAREKAEKEDKEKTALAERKDNCERARRQLAQLESGQRLAQIDSQGERRFLEDDERQREIERSRRIVAESCK